MQLQVKRDTLSLTFKTGFNFSLVHQSPQLQVPLKVIPGQSSSTFKSLFRPVLFSLLELTFV